MVTKIIAATKMVGYFLVTFCSLILAFCFALSLLLLLFVNISTLRKKCKHKNAQKKAAFFKKKALGYIFLLYNKCSYVIMHK